MTQDTDAEGQDANGEEGEGKSNEVETRARQMGWVDKDEFKGDLDKWRPADEFVRRGEQHLAVNRERLDHAYNEIDALKAKLAEQSSQFDSRIEKLDAANKKAFERQRQQLETKYAGAKRKAAEDGDLDAYDKLSASERKDLEALDAEAEDALAEQTPKRQERNGREISPEQQRTVKDFRSRNPWFDTDPVMTAAADAYHVQLLKDRPGMALDKNLAEVEKEMRRRFPEKFGGDDDEGFSLAEGGNRSSGGRARQKGARDLPAEARKAGEQFVKDGLYKDLAEYAKDYYEQEGAA